VRFRSSALKVARPAKASMPKKVTFALRSNMNGHKNR
jgi:hypothetical protein